MVTTAPDLLQARLAAGVTQALQQYASRLALVVQANPQGEITSLLDRPDVQSALRSALDSAQRQAVASVEQAWDSGAQGAPADRAVADSLRSDVRAAYALAPLQLRQAAETAWRSVPSRAFAPGVDAPGTNPQAEVAAQRAQEVRQALGRHAEALALRNVLSASVAAASARTAAVLGEAQPGTGVRWVASMGGKDPRSCAWCRTLHGITVAAGEQFPHPAEIGGRKPPRLYRGVLHGPPLHPNCQCRLERVAQLPPEPPSTPVEEEPPEQEFISSDDIRDMPEERYQSLLGFLGSALHELAQVIRAILGIQ